MKQTLGELLAKARGDRSLRWVADRANINHSYLKALEEDRVDEPSPYKLRSLAQTLHLSVVAVYIAQGYLKEHEVQGLSSSEWILIKKLRDLSQTRREAAYAMIDGLYSQEALEKKGGGGKA